MRQIIRSSYGIYRDEGRREDFRATIDGRCLVVVVYCNDGKWGNYALLEKEEIWEGERWATYEKALQEQRRIYSGIRSWLKTIGYDKILMERLL